MGGTTGNPSNGVPFKSLYQDYGGKIGKMADFGEFHPGTKPLP